MEFHKDFLSEIYIPKFEEEIKITNKNFVKEQKKFSNNYIKNLEKDIENTEEQVEELKAKLHSENNYELLSKISKDLEVLEEKLSELMEKWLEVEES
jgi:intergrase/recombinase